MSRAVEVHRPLPGGRDKPGKRYLFDLSQSHAGRAGAGPAVSLAAPCAGASRFGAEVHDAAIGEHDRLLQNMIDCLAVQDRSRAARIIRHHATDGGAACG